MDRTSILVLVVCFIFLMLWYPMVVNRLYPTKPLPPGSTNAAITSATGTNLPAAATPPSMVSSAPSAVLASVADTNSSEELLVLTNQEARYTFTSRGGGLKEVELLAFPEAVSSRRRKHSVNDKVVTLNAFSPAPTLALLGGEALQGDGIFQLSRLPNANGLRAEKKLTNGLTITKEFQLSTNYLIESKVRLENRSSGSLTLPPQEWVVGLAAPMGARDDGTAVGVLWYTGTKAEDVGGANYFSTHGFACTTKMAPTEYHGGASNVFWAAAHNQFFALAVMPSVPAQSLTIRRMELPRPTGEEAALVATNGLPPQGYQASLNYPSLTLSTNQPFERSVFIYAGPKEYRIVSRIADAFNNGLDQIMQFGSWFGIVSKSLLLGMNWLHDTLKFSYGWAIVAITIIIKSAFWRVTANNARSSKRMQALQPQVAAIKDKYKDDPLKTHQKTMELYKKHKVSPMGSCLPMLVQIPVFFGFLTMIRSAIELRGAPFLWAGDLTRPDTVYMIPGLSFIPFIGIPGVGLPINPLPLIMGATMLWQARITPPAPGMDPSQQAIMKYLPLIFLVGLYNFSAGLTLYWTVNNILTIIQTKLTRTTQTATPEPAKVPVLTPPQKKKK